MGKRTLVDEVRSGSSYISQNDLHVHFGLGATDKIEGSAGALAQRAGGAF